MSDNYQKYKVEMEPLVALVNNMDMYIFVYLFMITIGYVVAETDSNMSPGSVPLQSQLDNMILVAKATVTRITDACNLLLFGPAVPLLSLCNILRGILSLFENML